MGILVDNIQWMLLAAGLLTCSTIQATVAPRATVRTYFGEAPDSPQFDLVVRNWGMLITAAGALLICQVQTEEMAQQALDAGVPMVPIVLRHAGAVMPRGQQTIRSGTIEVVVLPPVDTEDWTAETLDDHVAEVRDSMQAVLVGTAESEPPKVP